MYFGDLLCLFLLSMVNSLTIISGVTVSKFSIVTTFGVFLSFTILRDLTEGILFALLFRDCNT